MVITIILLSVTGAVASTDTYFYFQPHYSESLQSCSSTQYVEPPCLNANFTIVAHSNESVRLWFDE